MAKNEQKRQKQFFKYNIKYFVENKMPFVLFFIWTNNFLFWKNGYYLLFSVKLVLRKWHVGISRGPVLIYINAYKCYVAVACICRFATMKRSMMSTECMTGRQFLQMLTIRATNSLFRIKKSVFCYWDRTGFVHGSNSFMYNLN